MAELLRFTVQQHSPDRIVITIESNGQCQRIVAGAPASPDGPPPVPPAHAAGDDPLAPGNAKLNRAMALGMLKSLGVKDPGVIVSRYASDLVIEVCRAAKERRSELHNVGGWVTKVLQRGGRV